MRFDGRARMTICAAVAILGFLFVLDWSGNEEVSSAPPRVAPDPPTHAPDPSRHGAEISPHQRVPVAAFQTSIAITVTDELGTPLPGTEARYCTPSIRWSEEPALAIANDKGIITLDRQVLRGDRQSISLTLIDFLTTQLSITGEPSYSVILRRALQLSGTVVSDDGAPIKSATIVASGRPLPRISIIDRMPEAPISAMPDAKTGLHITRTDAAGSFKLSGLPEGPLFYRVLKFGYYLRGVTPDVRRMPSPPVSFRLAPLYALTLRVDGDEIVAHRFLVRVPGMVVSETSNRLRHLLVDRHDLDFCELASPSIDSVWPAELHEPIEGEILLAKRGWIPTSIRWQRVEMLSDPDTLNASEFAEKPMASLVLELRNPDGAPIHGVEEPIGSLTPVQHRSSENLEVNSRKSSRRDIERRIPVRAWTKVLLPEGRYRFHASGTMLRSAIVDDVVVNVRASQEAIRELRLVKRLIPVRLRVEDTGGIPYESGSYNVLYPELKIREARIVPWGMPDRVFLWLTGNAVVTVGGWNLPRTERRVVVRDPEGSAECLDIVFVVNQ